MLWTFSKIEVFDWKSFKTYFAAPFLEEVLYRALIFRIHGASEGYMVLLLPLYFSFAHCHPVFKKLGKPGLSQELLIMSLKVAYTSLFGAYSGLVFGRTLKTEANLWGAVALHCQCNMFGLPSFGLVFD